MVVGDDLPLEACALVWGRAAGGDVKGRGQGGSTHPQSVSPPLPTSALGPRSWRPWLPPVSTCGVSWIGGRAPPMADKRLPLFGPRCPRGLHRPRRPCGCPRLRQRGDAGAHLYYPHTSPRRNRHPPPPTVRSSSKPLRSKRPMQLHCYRWSGAMSPMVSRIMREGPGSCPSRTTSWVVSS
jgi:hypothetical protein